MPELNCRDALSQLSTFLDGELDDQRRTDIDDHLGRCGHCHSVQHFESELRSVIRSGAAERVPEDLRQRILDQLRGETD